MDRMRQSMKIMRMQRTITYEFISASLELLARNGFQEDIHTIPGGSPFEWLYNAILLNTKGTLSEAAGACVFIVCNREVLTPLLPPRSLRALHARLLFVC